RGEVAVNDSFAMDGRDGLDEGRERLFREMRRQLTARKEGGERLTVRPFRDDDQRAVHLFDAVDERHGALGTCQPLETLQIATRLLELQTGCSADGQGVECVALQPDDTCLRSA